jgi:hypothetical protein
MTTKPLRSPLTTEEARSIIAWQDNYPHDGEHNPIWAADFDRWLNDLNPWPILDVRYDAAKASNLGDQLTSDERTERVRIELENAFAAGALWQYSRGAASPDALPTEEPK